MAEFKRRDRSFEIRRVDGRGDGRLPEGEAERAYDAARAHHHALSQDEPGYGYGEDYRRDRRRRLLEAERGDTLPPNLMI